MILEEIKMVEDTPDDLVHEIFTEHYWSGHPLGRPILGIPETVEALSEKALPRYFGDAYVAPNLIVSAAGNLDHAGSRALLAEAFGGVPQDRAAVNGSGPADSGGVVLRDKDSSRATSASAPPAIRRATRLAIASLHPQHRARRLDELAAVPEHPREARAGLRGVQRPERLSRRRHADHLRRLRRRSVGEVVDLVVEEMRGMKRSRSAGAELRRAKDHLKGNLMLSLESTSSRMSHLARQEIYFDRHSRSTRRSTASSGHGRRRAARRARPVLERLAGGDRARAGPRGARRCTRIDLDLA